MDTLLRAYRQFFSNRDFCVSFVVSLILLVLGVLATFYAGIYATDRASNFVTDIILSNTPVFDVDVLFVYGTFAILAFIFILGIIWPQRVPFVASSLGLFYFIRAIFISLTHLGPFPSHVTLDVGYMVGKFIGGGDMFFSGHTGTPFLLALIFWRFPLLRGIFLAWSVFFAAIVLLGHLHYSIDVVSAYFITYAIFHMAEFFFRRYRAYFYMGLPTT